MKQTLDTAPLYHSWDALMNSFIQVHEAISEREKSQALRVHAYALMEHINTLDAIVPDPDSTTATPLPEYHSTHNTGATITQDYTALHTTLTTTIPL